MKKLLNLILGFTEQGENIYHRSRKKMAFFWLGLHGTLLLFALIIITFLIYLGRIANIPDTVWSYLTSLPVIVLWIVTMFPSTFILWVVDSIFSGGESFWLFLVPAVYYVLFFWLLALVSSKSVQMYRIVHGIFSVWFFVSTVISLIILFTVFIGAFTSI